MSHMLRFLSLFLPLNVFSSCTSHPFQSNIRKQDSSSKNIAPVFSSSFSLRLRESGGRACAESLSLVFCVSACFSLSAGLFLLTFHILFYNAALCCICINLILDVSFRLRLNYCEQTAPLSNRRPPPASTCCVTGLDLVRNSQDKG